MSRLLWDFNIGLVYHLGLLKYYAIRFGLSPDMLNRMTIFEYYFGLCVFVHAIWKRKIRALEYVVLGRIVIVDSLVGKSRGRSIYVSCLESHNIIGQLFIRCVHSLASYI